MNNTSYKLRYLPLFEQYRPSRKRDHPYYRIYVKNYVIYYVIIDDIMEVRRLIYSARDTERHL